MRLCPIALIFPFIFLFCLISPAVHSQVNLGKLKKAVKTGEGVKEPGTLNTSGMSDEEIRKIIGVVETDSYLRLMAGVKRIGDQYAFNQGKFCSKCVHNNYLSDALSQAKLLSSATSFVDSVTRENQKMFKLHRDHAYRLMQISPATCGLEEECIRAKKFLDLFWNDIRSQESSIDDSLKNRSDHAVAMATGYKTKNQFIHKGLMDMELNRARVYLYLLHALKGKNDVGYTEGSDYFNNSEKQIENIDKEIRLSKIEDEKMPIEAYKGADKSSLKDYLKKEWQKKYPADKILSIVLWGNDWSRKTFHGWEGGQYFNYDFSVLNIVVVLKKDDKVAEYHHAEIRKDHKDGNSLNPFYLVKGNSPVPMLIKNVK